MFNNVGRKCKALAKVVCWLGIIGSIISGVALIVAGTRMPAETSTLYLGIGLVDMILGSLLSWLGSLSLYAIGETAENSAITANLAIKADMEKSNFNKSVSKEKENTPNEIDEYNLFDSNE